MTYSHDLTRSFVRCNAALDRLRATFARIDAEERQRQLRIREGAEADAGEDRGKHCADMEHGPTVGIRGERYLGERRNAVAHTLARGG